MKNVNLIYKGPGIRYRQRKPKASINKTKTLYVLLSLLLVLGIGGALTWAYINFLLPLKEVKLITLIEQEKTKREQEKPKELEIHPLKEDEKIAKTPLEITKEEQKKEPKTPQIKKEKREVQKKKEVARLEKRPLKKEEMQKEQPPLLFKEKNYSYVIHIASFRQFNNARRYMTSLVKKGYPAYIGFFKIPNKGDYYRILIGRFETRENAQDYIALLKQKGIVKSGRALKIPYSLELGTYDSKKSASKMDSELRKRGYSPLVLPVKSNQNTVKYKILVGAYTSKSDAEKASSILSDKGMKNSVIMP